MNLKPLREFGEEADRLHYPAIEEGGYIVPGGATPSTLTQATPKGAQYAREERERERQEARSSAGSWAGSSPKASAAGGSPYSVLGGLETLLDLDGLLDYHPQTRGFSSSSAFSYLRIPVGLFRALPYRATLWLEVPRERPLPLSAASVFRMPPPGMVPALRAWALTADGVWMRSHHENPDTSICACLPGEWEWGRDPIWRYAEWCITWIGKALHLQLLGRWPGQQHYPSLVRTRRDKPHEYCGCGSANRYGECCRSRDQATLAYSRLMEHVNAKAQYFAELEYQGRSSKPSALEKILLYALQN
jgi:hypothetical protein